MQLSRQHPPTRRSRRTLLQMLALAGSSLALGGLAGCALTPVSPTIDPADDLAGGPGTRPGTRPGTGSAAVASGPAGGQAIPSQVAPQTAPGQVTPAPAAAPRLPIPVRTDETPVPVLTVSVPPTPTSPPPTPVPTPTPRPRPRRAMLNVPYYSQHIGRLNYCLPTSIAMVADRYERLPYAVAGTPDRAPSFVADVGYRLARERITALNEEAFTALWEEIGTDPLGGLIWNVFFPNGRDLVAGMSPALAYLVLTFAFDLKPRLGILDECLVALADDVPSILFGQYGSLRRADGVPANVGGYGGPHAFVLVGVDYERALINDPLPADKIPYSGQRERRTATQRAVRFDLESVRRMTVGDQREPRGDCFMMYPDSAG